MNTERNDSQLPPEVRADLKAAAESIAAGKPLDPQVAQRIQQHADQVRQELRSKPGGDNFSVQVIREMRGPLDEEQERELTLAQREWLHKGEPRLVDPDTGEVYVLVPEDEYERLRNR
jgi:hypothetical protein